MKDSPVKKEINKCELHLKDLILDMEVIHYNMKFKVYRFIEDKKWYDTFEIKENKGMTVLEALLKVKEEQDGSLAFRYSCRFSVCGSCGMLINKVPRLACRTQIEDIKNEIVVDFEPWGPIAKPVIKISKEEILIEPLPNFQVIKDLIVDFGPFFKRYKEIEPWILTENRKSKEHLMENSKNLELMAYANCILCSLCYSACPVTKRNRGFLGPSALAQAWRFFDDPRYIKKKEMLDRTGSPEGVWECDGVYKCTEVCPKKVQPTIGIMSLRKNLLNYRLLRR